MFAELFRRRVPQIVGVYLVGSWAVLEFVDWAVGQYALSPQLTNFVVALAALLLPSVVLLAWRFGAPGDDQWTRTESVVVPLNLVVAATVLFVAFQGQHLGAATTTVVVEDETGNTVERVIPRNEFRRSALLFFFDNASADTTLDWLRFGLPMATETDLSQDMFITIVSPWEDEGQLLRELREAGFEDGVNAPLALKRKLAVDRHVDALVIGSLVQTDSGPVVESELYDAPRGKLIARSTFGVADPFEAADQMSEWLKRDLGLPSLQIEEAQDLPVAEILTQSGDAFRQFAIGQKALVHSDLATAKPWLEGAVQQDPSFALAQAYLALTYFLLQQPEEAEAAMQAARQHLYRLPERVQLSLRTLDYLRFQQKPEQAFKTAKYLVELYPQDTQGRSTLADILGQRGQWEEQISELEEILSIDPTQYERMQEIGRIYEEHAEYDLALGYFERYAELFPNDEQSFVEIGDLRRRTGDHESARAAYERALLIEPGDVTVMLRLGRLDLDQGDFEKAQQWSSEALAESRGPEDRYEVYGFEETLLHRQGMFARLEEAYRKRMEAASEYMIPANVAIRLGQSEALQMAPEAGRVAWAVRQLDSLRAVLPSPFDDLYGIMYAIPVAESGDLERARVELERGGRGILASGFVALQELEAYQKGLIHELEGACDLAVEDYREAVSLSPNSLLYATGLGRCQRQLGELDTAEATLLGVLDVVPADADVRYQLALVYQDAGRDAEAIEQLETAAEIWKNADADYQPALRARTKLAELQS